jgi:ribosomal protein S18 acetylase RimI-like enzyme
MTTSDARLAAAADVPAIGEALALAFHDDPVMAWLFGPQDEKTLRHLGRYLSHETTRHLKHPTVYTTDARAGAALWDPPGHWKTGVGEVLKLMPVMLPGLRHRVVRALRGLAKIEAAHDKHPEHYYLAVLGTRPDRQGQGIGATLLRPVLERCDQDGIGAYLESSKESNIPFYRRHGFEVVEEIHLPKGPLLYPMWRDPQVPDGEG